MPKFSSGELKIDIAPTTIYPRFWCSYVLYWEKFLYSWFLSIGKVLNLSLIAVTTHLIPKRQKDQKSGLITPGNTSKRRGVPQHCTRGLPLMRSSNLSYAAKLSGHLMRETSMSYQTWYLVLKNFHKHFGVPCIPDGSFFL